MVRGRSDSRESGKRSRSRSIEDRERGKKGSRQGKNMNAGRDDYDPLNIPQT